MRTIKELSHPLSVLCFRFVWCDASWLARGTQIQYNVETKTRQNKKTEEWNSRRRASWRRRNSCGEVTQAGDKKKQRGTSGRQPRFIRLEIFLPSEVFARAEVSAREGAKGRQRDCEPSSIPALLNREQLPAAGSHVPCHCHLPLHAVDSAEHRGCVWRAHRLHEHRLAGGVPPHPRRCLRPPWGHRSRRGLQADAGHLRPLYKAAPPAAGNTVRTLRRTFRGDRQRVLAGYLYLPGGGDPAAVCRGVHLSLHHVLPKHHEEKHL